MVDFAGDEAEKADFTTLHFALPSGFIRDIRSGKPTLVMPQTGHIIKPAPENFSS